jgi:DNA (cytosine-5)-methyltransferase 1
MPVVRFIDLFCGLGAFHHVLKQYNAECVFACDIDDKVREIYERNHGMKPEGDINLVDINNIPQHNLLCAGFPCQPFSIAGKQSGFQDKTKGTLFFKILEIIDAKLPEMIILENVKNLMTIDNGNTMKTIVDELEKRAYRVHSKVLNSVYFGSPQCRERLFIVALKDNTTFSFPVDNIQNVTKVHDILIDAVNSVFEFQGKYELKKVNSRTIAAKPKIIHTLINVKTGKGGRQGERIYDIQHPGPTICASSGGPGAKTGLYMVDNKIRRLTVVECLRMFGFPDDYHYHVDDNKMLFYLGNSIVTNVIDAIVKKLLFTNT